jgi:hypothetical protein
VTDAAPRVPGLGDGPDRAIPFSIDLLLANGALAAAAAGWWFLRRRASVVTMVIVLLPVVVLGVLRVMLAIDAVLPLTR